MSNLEKTFDIVKAKGLVLPTDIASELKIDSFLANAYLAQLAEMGKIKRSSEHVGSAFVYFLPGRERDVRGKIDGLLSGAGKTPRMFAKSIPSSPEVAVKQKEFASRLKEIEDREARAKQLVAAPKPAMDMKEDFMTRMKQAILPTVRKEEAKVSEVKIAEARPEVKLLAKFESPVVAKTLPEAKAVAVVKSKLLDKAMSFLNDSRAEIISREMLKRGKEASFIANFSSAVGPVKMLVLVKDKKSISETDLSHLYAEGLNKKLPVLFLTEGRLTKTAQSYLNDISGLVKIRQI